MWLDTPKIQRMFQQGERVPAGRGYGGYFAASQAFELGSLGLRRVGGFAYFGQAPTFAQFTQGGGGVPG
jgi:hypothetical protein